MLSEGSHHLNSLQLLIGQFNRSMRSLIPQLVIFVCIACAQCLNYGRMYTKLLKPDRHQLRLSDAIEKAPDVVVLPQTQEPSLAINTTTAASRKYLYKKPSPDELKAFNSDKSYPCSSERYRQGLNAVNYEK